jgi:hypothetical protein
VKNDRFELSSFLDITGEFRQFLWGKLGEERSEWVRLKNFTHWNAEPALGQFVSVLLCGGSFWLSFSNNYDGAFWSLVTHPSDISLDRRDGH